MGPSCSNSKNFLDASLLTVMQAYDLIAKQENLLPVFHDKRSQIMSNFPYQTVVVEEKYPRKKIRASAYLSEVSIHAYMKYAMHFIQSLVFVGAV